MEYIKIEQAVRRYDLETNIYDADEKEIDEYIKDVTFKHTIHSKNNHKFYKEIREVNDYDENLEDIYFEVVFFIPKNGKVFIEDCTVALNTKYSLLNKRKDTY